MKFTIYDLRFTNFAVVLTHVFLVYLTLGASAQTSFTNLDSKDVYPIDLPTALQLAGAQNLDIKIAREKLAEARADHESAVAQFFPWISPGITYRRHDNLIQDVGGNIIEVHKQSYAPGGTIGAQLDIGDAIYKSLAAKQLISAADHALESQRQDSTLAAAHGYFDLTLAQAAVDVAREAVGISADYEKQIQNAVEAGIAYKGDQLRAKVQLERNQLALRQAAEHQRIVAARLAQTLHLDPVVAMIARDADLVPLTLIQTNAALDSLVQQTFASRPELKQSQSLVTAARETKNGAVYGPMIPALGAQAFAGGLGGGKDGSPDKFGEQEDYFVGLSWRIGPGGLFDFGRINANNAQLATVQLGDAKLKDAITADVVASLTRVHSLSDQIALAEKSLGTANEALRLTRARKQFGVGIVLEDIQAQQAVTQARSDYFTAIAEFDKAQYGLNKAVGGASEGSTSRP